MTGARRRPGGATGRAGGAAPAALNRRAVLALALAAAAAPAAATSPEEPLLVFAAASLRLALDRAAAAFQAETGLRVLVSYGGSSALARQIQHGAPARLYLSANAAWMDVLEEDGLLADGSRTDLFGNRLVLIAAPGVDHGLTVAPGFDLAGALGDGRLAMALVDAVPAGIYGQAALRSLGAWEAVAPQVAQTANVTAALWLVASGEAPYGIVYATDAAAEPRVRVVGAFPADSHPPIVYPAAITAAGDSPQARALLAFLSSPRAGAIFRDHGFIAPGTRP